MTVRVRLFAGLRDAAGIGDVEVDAGPLPVVLGGLRDRYGEEFARRLAISSVLVNGDAHAHDDPTWVADGSEVALLPPVSGGRA